MAIATVEVMAVVVVMCGQPVIVAVPVDAVLVPPVLGIGICPGLLCLKDEVDVYPRKLQDG